MQNINQILLLLLLLRISGIHVYLFFLNQKLLQDVNLYARKLSVPNIYADSFTLLILQCVPLLSLFHSTGIDNNLFLPHVINYPWFQCLFPDYSISMLLHSFIYVPQETLYYICYCVGWNIHYSCPCFLLRVVFVSRKISPKI